MDIETLAVSPFIHYSSALGLERSWTDELNACELVAISFVHYPYVTTFAHARNYIILAIMIGICLQNYFNSPQTFKNSLNIKPPFTRISLVFTSLGRTLHGTANDVCFRITMKDTVLQQEQF